MNWNKDRMKLYMEAGLAVLLVLTLALAGAVGVFSGRGSSVRAEQEQSSGNSGSGQENGSTGDGQTDTQNSDGAEDAEAAEASCLIMGESSVTVQQMVD